VSVASVVPGAADLGGTFQLQFGGITTAAIANNAKPSAVQAALVAAGVAGVEVTAGATGGTTAHSWRVTFAHCSTGAIAGSDLCNDGNVANLVVLSGGLTGCSPLTPAVLEVIPGSAGTVLLVSDLTGGAPYSTDITGLAPGVPAYVRVSAHTQKSFGYRALPSPLMATPSSVKPGQMEPVRLKSSTASTISKWTHSQYIHACNTVLLCHYAWLLLTCMHSYTSVTLPLASYLHHSRTMFHYCCCRCCYYTNSCRVAAAYC
jgi:hypothetical protein